MNKAIGSMKPDDKMTVSEMPSFLMAIDEGLTCNAIRPLQLAHDENGMPTLYTNILIMRSDTVGKMMNMILSNGMKRTSLFVGSIEECFSTSTSKIPDDACDPSGVMKLDVGSDWSDVEAIKLVKNILRHGRTMLVYHGERILVGPFVCYDLRLQDKRVNSYLSHTDMS